jgi:hypothetical protein
MNGRLQAYRGQLSAGVSVVYIIFNVVKLYFLCFTIFLIRCPVFIPIFYDKLHLICIIYLSYVDRRYNIISLYFYYCYMRKCVINIMIKLILYKYIFCV